MDAKAFHHAIESGNLPAVRAGIEAGMLANVHDHIEALKHAVIFAQHDAFTLLADHARPDGVNIFMQKDRLEDTLLHWMAKHPLREVPFVEPVAARMADLDIRDGSGQTALKLFARNGMAMHMSDEDLEARGQKESGVDILLRLGARTTASEMAALHGYAAKIKQSDFPPSDRTERFNDAMLAAMGQAMETGAEAARADKNILPGRST